MYCNCRRQLMLVNTYEKQNLIRHRFLLESFKCAAHFKSLIIFYNSTNYRRPIIFQYVTSDYGIYRYIMIPKNVIFIKIIIHLNCQVFIPELCYVKRKYFRKY